MRRPPDAASSTSPTMRKACDGWYPLRASMDASRRVVLSRSAAVRQVSSRPEAAFHQLPGGRFLVVVAELLQGRRRNVPVDALVRQLPAEGTLGQLAGLRAAPHPHVGKLRVVDQPDLFKTVQDRGGDVLGHIAFRQLALELEPALGRTGQLSQHNGARHRRRVGVPVLRDLSSAAALGTRRTAWLLARRTRRGAAAARLLLEPVNGLQLR